MLDRTSEPTVQQDRQPIALLGELLPPSRVIFDDVNRHIDH
jgi:hypothetical protein